MSEQLDLKTPSGPGERLRKKRVGQGWSLDEVARALSLSVRQVEALEADRYDELPGPTYIAGYWRSYANFVGIDVSREIEAYRNQLRSADVNIVLEPDHRRAHKYQEQSRKRLAPLFLALSAVFLGGIWYWQKPDENPTFQWTHNPSDGQVNIIDERYEAPVLSDAEQLNVPSPGKAENTSGESGEALPEPNFSEWQTIQSPRTAGDSDAVRIHHSRDESAVETAGAANDAAGPEIVSAADASKPDSSDREEFGEADGGEGFGRQTDIFRMTGIGETAKTAETTINDGELAAGNRSHDDSPDRIVFDVDSRTWLDVRDNSGVKLVYRIVEGGETIELNGIPPFSVFIGASHGVAVSYLGSPVAFKPHESGLFARFDVGKPNN